MKLKLFSGPFSQEREKNLKSQQINMICVGEHFVEEHKVNALRGMKFDFSR